MRRGGEADDLSPRGSVDRACAHAGMGGPEGMQHYSWNSLSSSSVYRTRRRHGHGSATDPTCRFPNAFLQSPQSERTERHQRTRHAESAAESQDPCTIRRRVDRIVLTQTTCTDTDASGKKNTYMGLSILRRSEPHPKAAALCRRRTCGRAAARSAAATPCPCWW